MPEGPSNHPDENASGLEEFWQLAEVYLANEERSEAEPRELFQKSAAAFMGISNPDSIYVAKATPNGYRNQVWQGQALTRAKEALVLIDKTGNDVGIADAARLRLNPVPENGYDSIVICERDGGGWKIRGVAEYEHENLGDEIKKLVGAIETKRLPDPAASAEPAIEQTPHSLDNVSTDFVAHLQEAKNLVLGGPPGTGKSFLALKMIDQLATGPAAQCRLDSVLREREWRDVPVEELRAPTLVWEFIQLHPSYTYEDFVRGMRTDPGKVGFSLAAVDGILPIMCHVASVRTGKPTVLILDELNRCNVPVVFGETIFAIDPSQRGRPIRLQYDGIGVLSDSLRVPPDLLVIATMNTADRSIAALDFAIRRRFRYLFLGPSEDALTSYYKDTRRSAAAIQLLRMINSKIPDREIQVGHSYLMVGNELESGAWRLALAQKVSFEVCPLLREYNEERLLSEASALSIGEIEIDLINTAEDTLVQLLAGALATLVPDEQE